MPNYTDFFKTLVFGVETLPQDYKLDQILQKETVHYGSFYCRFAPNYDGSPRSPFARIGYEFASENITKPEFDEALVQACKQYIEENPYYKINVELALIRVCARIEQ